MFSFKYLTDKKKGPLVMGILNITPDSFSDGGKFYSLSGALERLEKLYRDGADIIDIGACSTAPKNTVVSEAEELDRLGILPELVKNAKVPLSIDTFRPAVAKFALENGVSIINDESGIFDNEMAAAVKEYNAGWIFMHTGGKSSKDEVQYTNGVVEDVLSFFCGMKDRAVSFGINEDCLCYDCGIGFGKSRKDDISLLKECETLSRYSPLLIGVSRKRVIGEITGKENPQDRVAGSVAAALNCAIKGARILRVHDVDETVDALKIFDKLS